MYLDSLAGRSFSYYHISYHTDFSKMIINNQEEYEIRSTPIRTFHALV